jgi:hypothetical protein
MRSLELGINRLCATDPAAPSDPGANSSSTGGAAAGAPLPASCARRWWRGDTPATPQQVAATSEEDVVDLIRDFVNDASRALVSLQQQEERWWCDGGAASSGGRDLEEEKAAGRRSAAARAATQAAAAAAGGGAGGGGAAGAGAGGAPACLHYGDSGLPDGMDPKSAKARVYLVVRTRCIR